VNWSLRAKIKEDNSIVLLGFYDCDTREQAQQEAYNRAAELQELKPKSYWISVRDNSQRSIRYPNARRDFEAY
jgi:hypothetical protein